MTDGVRRVSEEARRDDIGKYGLPRCLSGKESACQSRRFGRCRFDPRIRKIPWKKKWQPIPIFLPEKIPWTEEIHRLQFMGLQRVRHDGTTDRGLMGKCTRRGIIFRQEKTIIFYKRRRG